MDTGTHGKFGFVPDTTPESIPTISVTDRARKNSRTLGKAIDAAGIVPTAEAAGIGKSTVASWFNEHRDALGKALAHLGLKVVPVSVACYPPEQVEALFTMAQAHMRSMRSAADLFEEVE